MPNGEQWIEGGIVGVLDRLFESGARPAIVALVPMRGWVGGSWGGRAVTLLGEEALPAIEAAYPIAEGIEHRALWTVEDKAAVGLQLAAAKPQRFGRFAFQSPKLYFGEPPPLDGVDDATAFRVSWSRYEMRSVETGVDERADARALFERLRGAGFETDGGEIVAGPGYRTWRTEAAAILAFLLGG
jgi:enterochelin esterase-like enzyme